MEIIEFLSFFAGKKSQLRVFNPDAVLMNGELISF